MTLDGFCDHTAGLPDAEIHQHYTELLAQGDMILYGRTTYQLMEFWRTLLANPSEEKSMNDVARAIDKIEKRVFSRTMKTVDWASATLAQQDLHEEVLALKQQPGRAIFVGSRSLIIQLLQLELIDEFQLCLYPVVAGSGLPLFENLNDRMMFNLVNHKTFTGGALLLYYQPKNE
ncbi:dihydrofolate reductase [Catalinimonas alkaloidigena]|uniref:Dihydrofolate reductase n=2 Tax=Catalinimonas alkaloidigena TaxID=1075417 RepID=A0A1G9TZE6_9BACT|nr:dihydrofolate reductase [Catalinimonas alkaloidigena]